MFTLFPAAATASKKIEFVGSYVLANQSGNANRTLTSSIHQVDDYLLTVIMNRGVTTIPSLSAGWSNLGGFNYLPPGLSAPNNRSIRLGDRYAESTANITSSWNGHAGLIMIFRNVEGVGSVSPSYGHLYSGYNGAQTVHFGANLNINHHKSILLLGGSWATGSSGVDAPYELQDSVGINWNPSQGNTGNPRLYTATNFISLTWHLELLG